MGNYGAYSAIKTLLMIPLYFLLDWILRQILHTLFCFVTKEEETSETDKVKDPVVSSESTESISAENSTGSTQKALFKPIEFDGVTVIHCQVKY